MSVTKDMNELMTRWMKWYMNMMIIRSSDSVVEERLRRLKDKLAEWNEYMMRFFDDMGVEPID